MERFLSDFLNLTRYHFVPLAGSLVPVIPIWLGKGHAHVPEKLARRLPHLHLAEAADRAEPLSRIIGARAIPGSHGHRLLQFPGIAGGHLRCRPRRVVRGAQHRQSGADLSARQRRPWRLGGAGICGVGAEGQTHRGAWPRPMRRHPRLCRQDRADHAGRLHRQVDGDVHQARRESSSSAPTKPCRIS